MATKDSFSERDHAEATRRGRESARRPTALIAASIDEKSKTLHLLFRAGMELSIPIKAIDEIARAPIAKLRDMKASVDGLYFSEFGEMVYVPGLLRDLFGDAFAGALGKVGGRSTSPAKRAASRKNGRKGGRPHKAVA